MGYCENRGVINRAGRESERHGLVFNSLSTLCHVICTGDVIGCWEVTCFVAAILLVIFVIRSVGHVEEAVIWLAG